MGWSNEHDDQLVIVESNPFPNTLLWLVDSIGCTLMTPFGYFLDEFLSCFMPTTKDLQKPHFRYSYCALAGPLFLILTVLTFPPSVVGLIMWLLVCQSRVPYRTSTVKKKYSIPAHKPQYSFGTINTCLIQECIAKFNNMSHTRFRSKAIGQNMASQQMVALKNHNDVIDDDVIKPWSVDGEASFSDIGLDHRILTEFPPCDFLFFQEAWLLNNSRRLAKQLHKVYPYIVYDVVENGLHKNYFCNTSGLMVASKYPILDMKFNRFTASHKQCRLASKGCLHLKVHLGNLSDGRKLVGFLHSTHLQAYQGTEPIHCQQMSQLDVWTDQFRNDVTHSDDVIIFDILGGDFNSDNMSPLHEEEWHHPLFRKYVDVCRAHPGLDQPWSVGTDMRHLTMQDDVIQTPEGLKAALEDPITRQYYVCDANITNAVPGYAWELPEQDKAGDWIVSPVGGKRRIDFILPRQGTPVKVAACNPVTQLAGLTDHVAYSLTLKTHLPIINKTR